jgi:D-aminopeptidase
MNAITDVAGVRVGHETLYEGAGVRTGVTVVLAHHDDPYRWRVPAALFVGNGYGKLVGATQVRELGELETPVALTNTLCVARAAEALVDWTLSRKGNARVQSVNPFVGETNDGHLNDIRARSVRPEHVLAALAAAADGPVALGTVGAGTGTMAFGFKGGIGSSSRRLPAALGGFTVGVLVQSNFGGVLQVAGRPVGVLAGRHYLRDELSAGGARAAGGAPRARAGAGGGAGGAPDRAGAPTGSAQDADGSIMIVIATDAPLSSAGLERLAFRSMAGLARTGAAFSNGSGDYAVAFSTAEGVRRRAGGAPKAPTRELGNDDLSPLFLATIEATEEAIYDSLCLAVSVTGHEGHVGEALPLELLRL